MHLTTKQQVLLHIYRFRGKRDAWEAPYELSQAGICGALHLPQSTISRALKSLKDGGLIEDRIMYIRGERRKKTAYFLTPTGFEEAVNTDRQLSSEPVKIKLRNSIKDVSIGEAIEIIRSEKGIPLHPLEIYRQFIEKGMVDIADIYSTKKGIMFHVPEETKDFIGREEEMSAIKKKLEKSVTVLVKGMAGMGKSSLISRLVRIFAQEYHIFWYSIRRAKGLLDLIKELNEFLRLVGAKTVERKAGANAFFEELQNIKAILVFDDLQYADRETLGFIRELTEKRFSEPNNFVIILLSREDLFAFRKEDVARGRIFEIELESLKKNELESLFPDRDELEKVYSLTGGIPLFIELYRNTDLRAFEARRILEEEVFSVLSPEELEAMKLLSVHRIPVYPEALSQVDSETIEKLRKKLLIVEREAWKLDAHDLLKEMLYRSLSLEERKKYHNLAAKYYLSQWCADEDRFEAVYHLQRAEKWKESAETALNIASETTLSGDVENIILNFQRNMDRIPEALRGELLLLMGDILAYKNRWEDSLEYYSMAGKYLKNAEELKERIARANFEAENWDESARIEEELLKKAQQDGNERRIAMHQISLGNIYLRSENPAEALKYYLDAEKILKKRKTRYGLAVVYNNIASAYIKLEDLERGERYLKESLKYSKKRENSVIQAVANLGYIYEMKGDIDAAERAYREVLKSQKNITDSLKVLRRLNSILLNRGAWKEAVNILQKVLNNISDEEKWRVLDLMADAYRKGKKYEDAVARRREALSLNQKTRLRLSLIEDLVDAGREEAIKLLEDEEKIVSPWDYETRIKLLFLKGKALSMMGKRNLAADAYGELVRMAEEAGDMEKAAIARNLLKKME